MRLEYRIPEKLQLSSAVKDLLARIFVKDPAKRITIAQIKQHPWYLHRLPYELQEGYHGFERCAATVSLTAAVSVSSVQALSSKVSSVQHRSCCFCWPRIGHIGWRVDSLCIQEGGRHIRVDC